MTLAHSLIDTLAEENVSIKSEDESDDNVDSNESVNGSNSEESENDSVKSENSHDESDKESDESENENDTKINKGWADQVAKILKTNKPKGKKTLVLSKAKKLTDVKKEPPKDPGFQIEGELKEEKPDPLQLLDEVKEESDEPLRKKKKEVLSVRVKPTLADKERERALAKIATRGVVQLFNAVRAQQKDIDQRLEEAGPLERNKDKVLKSIDKRQFLDVLMGGEQAKSQAVDGPVKADTEATADSTWGVLRDDFMLSAKFKDWDKQQDDDNDELNDL